VRLPETVPEAALSDSHGLSPALVTIQEAARSPRMATLIVVTRWSMLPTAAESTIWDIEVVSGPTGGGLISSSRRQVVSRTVAQPQAAATAAERMKRGIGRPPMRRNGLTSRLHC
jgi:hypothetical protein